jgi:hypothetical protein
VEGATGERILREERQKSDRKKGIEKRYRNRVSHATP